MVRKIRLAGMSLLIVAAVLAGFLGTAQPAQAQVIVYSQGFETDDGGYTHTGTLDQWEWGTPTAGPGAANSGSKCWGTDLDGEIPQNSDSYLTSLAIPIPALGADEIARVRFYAWIAVDEMNDRGEFQVSADGSTWETKAELLHTMLGGWTEYYFDVSDYAGGNIYLRFRCRGDSVDYFDSTPYNMAGLYIDDVAILIYTAPPTKTILTLEAWEDQSSYASCPWVCPWDGSEYVLDNDIYSTARGPAKEFRDYYTMNKPLLPKDGEYSLELQELRDESSYTDLVQLMAVDHPSAVNVAADDEGNVWTYSSPGSPVSAVDDEGSDVLSQIATQDDAGFKAFNEDYIVLDFSTLDTSSGATLVLRALGFQNDEWPGDPTYQRPYIFIQTQDSGGDWATRNAFYPRDDWSLSAYDLSGDLVASQLVRLYITSCHDYKYHLIDYVGLDTSPQAAINIYTLSPTSAVRSDGTDVLSEISAPDGSYANMSPAQKITLDFPVPEMAGEARDFVFVAEGHYVPMGTFFIYTWDGSGWAQRDGWSVDGSGDQTQTFDLSLWMPDPNGEYKVRIWQDYWYSYAGIDYVGLSRGGNPGTMALAWDLKKAADVTTELLASDDNKDNWTVSDQIRNRWVEVTWTGLAVNIPPTTNPVTVAPTSSATPTIGWTYNDADADPQVQYEVEAWTGSGGTGSNVWDPAVGSGTGTSVVYAGDALVDGQTYYARVKAFDGTSWGGWSETSWTYQVDNGEEPPIEVGGDVNPVNKLTLLLPWIGLAAVAIIIAGVTLVVRRRRTQS